MMNDFEKALIAAGYKVSTPSGKPSTVHSYLYAIDQVCDHEGCNLSYLASNISALVQKYDIGGSEESFGARSKYTVINALRAFEQFVNTGSVIKKK